MRVNLPACRQRFVFTEKMKIFSWLSCILIAVTAVIAENTKEPPTELQIETTFKPDSCPHQAKAEDYIHVHYVSHWGAAILVEFGLIEEL